MFNLRITINKLTKPETVLKPLVTRASNYKQRDFRQKPTCSNPPQMSSTQKTYRR